MGRKLYRNADSEFLVSKIREVGSRSKVDRVKLVSASITISNRDMSDILAGLGNIASDGLVSPVEKRQLDMLFRQLKAEYPTVASEAEKYKELPDWNAEYTAQLEAYEKAYSDFSSLLSEILKDMKASSPVSQAQLSTIAQAYYTALSALDSTLQQFRYGIDRMEFRYKATQTQTKPDAEDVTLEEVPTLSSTDKYLWRRQTIYYTSGKVDVTVDLIAVYGDSGADGADGKDAKVCTIVCDRDYVERNDRLSDSLVYTFTIEVQGYAGVATIEVNGVDRTGSLSAEGSRYTLKVTVARKEAYALTVVVKLDGEEMARLALSVIDRTGSALYLGEFSDSLPTSSQYGMLIEGDYFMAEENFTDSSNNQYAKGVPYAYRKDGSNWVWSPLDSTDKDYNTKMLECMGGVMKSGIAVPSSAALYGWFQNLVAQNAVIANLFARKIKILDQGEIASANYYDTPASMQRFRIKANGEAEFYGITVKNATIDGDSIFNGEIASPALSTTLEKGGGSGSYSLGLDTSNPYWLASDMQTMMASLNLSDGYHDISGSYSEVHQGASQRNVLAKVTNTSNHATYFYPPRDQQLEIVVNWSGSQGNINCVCNNGKSPSGEEYGRWAWYPSYGNTRLVRDYAKGTGGAYPTDKTTVYMDIGVGTANDSGTYLALYDYFEDPYVFWDSNGKRFIPASINEGAFTVNGKHPTYVYKFGGMSSTSGSLNVNGTLTLKTADGSYNISNVQLYSISWTTPSSVTFTDTNYNKYVVDTNSYYYAFNASYSNKTTINSVSTVTVLPKNSASDIGSSDNRYQNGFFNNLSSNSIAGNLNGNVNYSGTSNRVYGAVFN